MRLPLLIAVMLFILGTHTVRAAPQSHVTDAVLTGTVYDQFGAPLANVSIEATHTGTTTSRSTLSAGNGRYILPALDPGLYRLTASLTGFAKQIFEGVVLELGQTVNIEIKMRPAPVEFQVTVIADTPLIDLRRTAITSVVNERLIDNLPINGRNFIGFSVLTPAVGTDNLPDQGAAATSGLTFTGQRARSNNITVDGLDNNDDTVGATRAIFSQEAIREFQVLTHSYSAEFGKASAGVVNIITKSGSNKVRGNLFFYLRDDCLNAKSHFATHDIDGNPVDRNKEPYDQKQWGGTFGGPIKKDESFLFLSFERSDRKDSNFVAISSTTSQALQAKGFQVGIGHVPYAFKSSQTFGKYNHRLNTSHSLALSSNYSEITNENIEPFGGIVARSRAAVLLRTDWSISAEHIFTGLTKWLNEFRIQLAGEDQTVNSLDPNCAGPCVGDFQGGPTVEITGEASVGRQRFTPQARNATRLQVMDTISYFQNDHIFKAGIDFGYSRGGTSLPLHFGARYIFAPLPAIPQLGLTNPISALQAFELDLPAAYVQGYGDPRTKPKTKAFSLFLQDEWRLSERLLVKLGVRYQRQSFWDIEYAVPGLINHYKCPSDTNNIAPRLGLALDLTGNARTNIHASYGMFYDNILRTFPSVTDIVDGREGVRTLAVRFPSSIAAWKAPGRKIPEPDSYPSLVISIDPELKTPYAHHVSFGVDQALGRELSLSASFIHVRGKKQVGTIDYNPIVPSLGPGRRPLDVAGQPGTSASVLQYTSFAQSRYRGLSVSLRRRFSSDYEFMFSYTLSKAEDNSTDIQSAFIPEDNGYGRSSSEDTGLPVGFDPNSEKGLSIQHQRHRLVASGLYQLPWSFQVSAIACVASGPPFNILAGADLNGDGNGGAFPPDRARTNPGDPSSSLPRNSGFMPYKGSVDLRVSRSLSLSERFSMLLIFEAFNLFNRTNFTEINNIFGVGSYPDEPLPTYGRYTAAGPPRQIQLALKFNF